MRTKELCAFYKNISNINNHLSHTIFVFKQFSIDNKPLVSKNPEKLTTEVYNSLEYVSDINIFTEQFNVKLKNIDEQAQKSLDYIFDTIFVMVITHFEVYLKDAYLFVKNNSKMGLAELPQSNVYQETIERLKIDLENDVENLYVSTFDYFKFRRNAIMHRDKGKRFQGAMEDLIKGKNPEKLFRNAQFNGAELNLNWKRHRQNLIDNNLKGHTIHNFDFANRNLDNFNIDELHDVFNFFRLYSSLMDNLIIKNLTKEELINYCVMKYKEFYKPDSNKNLKFVTNIRRTSKFELNLNLTDEDIEKINIDV